MRASDIVFALAAALPLSAAGLLAGAMLERAGVSARVREWVFGLAFWIGPLAGLLALIGHALPRPAAVEIIMVLRSTPLAAVSRATHAIAEAPPRLHLPETFDVVLAVITLGLTLRLAQLARAWLALKALRRDAAEAPVETVRALRAAGLRAPVRLSAEAPTPVAVGLFRPEILLPERFAAPEAASLAALVCRHEAEHIRRRDNLRLWLEQAAGALYWFDPLGGALHRRLTAAREERCDAAALAGCTPAERTLYARTLVDEWSQPPALALAVGLIGLGRRRLAARISAIIDPEPAVQRPVLTLAICAGLGCTAGGTALAASQADPPSLARTVNAVAAALPPSVREGITPVEPPTEAANPANRAVRLAAGPSQRPAQMLRTDEDHVIQRIVVEGNDRVPASLIVSLLRSSRMAIKPGSAVTAADLDLAEKLLFNGGLFSDVSLLVQADDTLRVKVTEKPDALAGRLRSSAAPGAQDGGPISLSAERVEDLKDGDGVRWVGDVQLGGDLKSLLEHGRVLFDGQPAPANFVAPTVLTADAIEVRFQAGTDGLRGALQSMNILGLRGAR
jgi:beta-lactamase regulating signal transducer with metallopeptidase domain